MLRLLHTGDLHIGKTLGKRPRLIEQARVLDEILDVAARREVDVVLIAGDVFDHRLPTPEAERVFFTFLSKATQQGLLVLIVTGNHDAPVRWGAHSGFLAMAGVHVFNTESVQRVLVGPRREKLDVAALPWVPLQGAVTSAALVAGQAHAAYADQVALRLARLGSQARPDAPMVLMAHLLVDQSLVGGGENRLSMSDVLGIQPQSLPVGPHYTALGHVHRPQSIGPAGIAARYCGSPLQMDFGETSWDPSVVIVEIEAPDQPARIQVEPLVSGKRLAVVRGTADEILAQAPLYQGHHVQLRVRQAEPLESARGALLEAFPSVIDMQLQRPAREAAPRNQAAPGTERTLWESLTAYAAHLDSKDSRLQLRLLDATSEALLERLRQQARGDDSGDTTTAAPPADVAEGSAGSDAGASLLSA